MADPASIAMDALTVALEQVGVIWDADVVSLQVIDEQMRIERVVRNSAGLPERSPDTGGVKTDWSYIPLTASTP